MKTLTYEDPAIHGHLPSPPAPMPVLIVLTRWPLLLSATFYFSPADEQTYVPTLWLAVSYHRSLIKIHKLFPLQPAIFFLRVCVWRVPVWFAYAQSPPCMLITPTVPLGFSVIKFIKDSCNTWLTEMFPRWWTPPLCRRSWGDAGRGVEPGFESRTVWECCWMSCHQGDETLIADESCHGDALQVSSGLNKCLRLLRAFFFGKGTFLCPDWSIQCFIFFCLSTGDVFIWNLCHLSFSFSAIRRLFHLKQGAPVVLTVFFFLL